MSPASVELSAPYTLFRLSLPLHQTRAKDREGASYRACFTAPVESRKRKRPVEIAAAVDGEGVHIYDPRTTKTVSSYAVPSTTRFSCAPASTVRTDSALGKLRRTYAATSAPKKELFCWQEQLDGAGGIEKSSKNIGSKHDVVHLLDTVPARSKSESAPKSEDRGVVAVFADGSVKCYSPDVEEERWALASSESDSTVLHATTTTFSTARKALLRNRPTALAAFQDVDVQPTILLLVLRVKDTITVRLLAVPADGKRPARNLASIDHLLVDDAPGSSFAVHFPTATLFHLTSTALATYNLAEDSPSKTSTLPLSPPQSEDAHPPSMLRISSTSVLIATSDGLSLYDTKFGSLQAHVPVDSPSSTAIMSRASTPASMASTPLGDVFLTSYIAELDLAIGFTQNGIVGVQLSYPTPADRNREGASLMDAICKGVRTLQVENPSTTIDSDLAARLADRNRQIDITIERLRECVAKRDSAEFDQIFCGFVGFDLSKVTQCAPAVATIPNGMVNGTVTTHDHEETALAKIESPLDGPFRFPKKTKKPLPTRFAHAVLGLCFSKVNADDHDRMKASIFPAYALRYLVETGNFSTVPLPVRDGLVEALVDHDPSLHTVDWFLRHLPELSITEVTRAVELSMTSTRASVEQQTAVLRTSLTRLATFPPSAVIQVLKDLPSETQFLLIRLLENELIGYDDSTDPAQTLGIHDIRTVADLLTTLVDAIGMSGLLLPETEELLHSLSLDVDDALVAVEEAAELKGLLEELFRHVNWTQSKRTFRGVQLQAPAASAPPTETEAEKTKRYIEKARAKKERRLARIEAAKSGKPLPPTPKAVKNAKPPQLSYPNNVPVGINPKKFLREQRKREKARRDAAARKKFIEKMQNRSKASVGHKKMLRLVGITRAHLEKQDQPVPTKMAVQASPILPMGVLALRRLVDPSYGTGLEFRPREEKEDGDKAPTMAGVFWREGLAAGVYSVESVVV